MPDLHDNLAEIYASDLGSEYSLKLIILGLW